MGRFQQRSISFLLQACLAAIAVILVAIPMQILLTQAQFPHPQAILMLGGSEDREHFTAQFARRHPDLDIWVSSGSARRREIFQAAGFTPGDRLHFDDQATDTVTHFTTLLPPFKVRGIRHVYLITSDFHMRRALAIATVIFGSRGLIVTPVPVPSQRPPETTLHVTRDIGRSLLWLFTGWSGAQLNPEIGQKK